MLNYVLDRKFVIQKLNELFNNQEDLNTHNAYAKGIRDMFAREFNAVVELWKHFLQSPLIIHSVYLNSELFTTYDPFKHLYTEAIYEANKFFACVVLNTFINCDLYVDIICLCFNEHPLFALEKGSTMYNTVEQVISSKVYDSFAKNLQRSCEASMILCVVIYAVLSAVKEKFTTHAIGDFAQISMKDVIDIHRREEDMSMTHYDVERDLDALNVDSIYDNMEDIGVYRISLQQTKTLVETNLTLIERKMNEYLQQQKQLITTFNCANRRGGIIPMVKKGVNFVKLVLAVTNGVKTRSLLLIVEEFKNTVKDLIIKIAHNDRKYTFIVLVENYHYMLRFFKSLNDVGMNVDNAQFLAFEEEFNELYCKYTRNYVEEVFDYQFHEFNVYYNELRNQYKINGKKVKAQSNYTLAQFEKKVNAGMLNSAFNKQVDTMAKRVVKHYCKEEGLGETMWKEVVMYFVGVVEGVEKVDKEVYEKEVGVKESKDVIVEYNFKEVNDKK